MAFDSNAWVTVGGQERVGEAAQVFAYRAPAADKVSATVGAGVNADDYFAPMAATVRVGDLILVSGPEATGTNKNAGILAGSKATATEVDTKVIKVGTAW